MNPYAGGACRAFSTASVSRAICTRVAPGGNSPFSGKSSKVIATFWAADTFTITSNEITKQHFMAESLQEEPHAPRVLRPCRVLCDRVGILTLLRARWTMPRYSIPSDAFTDFPYSRAF